MRWWGRRQVVAPVTRVPVAALLSHDLARATATLQGRPVTLDDLLFTDQVARLLSERWQRAPR